MMHRFLFSEIKPMNKIVLYFMKDPHKKALMIIISHVGTTAWDQLTEVLIIAAIETKKIPNPILSCFFNKGYLSLSC